MKEKTKKLVILTGYFKEEGAVTILAGPQAMPDYKGETGRQSYPHRFQGLSQINLTLRADYLLKGLVPLKDALDLAVEKNVRILLSSIGFESFDDTILKNLNKGLDRQTNLDAVKAIRSLKAQYPAHLGYLKEEGANHGFIHPIPWDNPKISREINKTISMYQLSYDILPNHSTPLIIHHASGLADWIRQIEVKENIEFERVGTTIGWWQTKDKVLL